MSEQVRAIYKGRESTMSRFFAEKLGAEILDSPPLDEAGQTRPMVVVDDAAAAGVESYDDMTVKQLRAVIDDRNATQDPDGEEYLAVGSRATKADLVAALQADDENHQAAGNEPAGNDEE